MNNKRKYLQTKNAQLDEDIGDIDLNAVSDSEDDYTETDQKLLEKVRTRHTTENYDSEDEVYGLQNEEDDDDDDDDGMANDQGSSMASDIEGLEEDYDLPNEKAWGKNKKSYYYTDYVDQDYASASQKDLEQAENEEQEARNIQKRLAEQLDDADFGLEFVQSKEDIKEVEDQHVKTDLSKLTKRQKQALMQKESPEFTALVNDFKERMTEARDTLDPFLKIMKNSKLAEHPTAIFVKTKYELILNYCVNISFYLMLKAKRLPVNSHPVIKRLAQYRQLLSQLQSGQGKLLEQITEILGAHEKGLPLYNSADNLAIDTNKKQVSKSILKQKLKVAKEYNQEIEKEEVDTSDNVSTNENDVDEDKEMDTDEYEEDNEVEESPDMKNTSVDANEKRAITYQIAKNKGLTPHRKKEQRNPRVKHRNKYRKAKIRRKGAVREVRKELTRYGGEIFGIKAGVKKGIKLK